MSDTNKLNYLSFISSPLPLYIFLTTIHLIGYTVDYLCYLKNLYGDDGDWCMRNIRRLMRVDRNSDLGLSIYEFLEYFL